jgi:hypothetical protein
MYKLLHVKYPLLLPGTNKLELSRQIFEKMFKCKNFMKILPVRATFLHADGQDESNSLFSQFSERN